MCLMYVNSQLLNKIYTLEEHKSVDQAIAVFKVIKFFFPYNSRVLGRAMNDAYRLSDEFALLCSTPEEFDKKFKNYPMLEKLYHFLDNDMGLWSIEKLFKSIHPIKMSLADYIEDKDLCFKLNFAKLRHNFVNQIVNDCLNANYSYFNQIMPNKLKIIILEQILEKVREGTSLWGFSNQKLDLSHCKHILEILIERSIKFGTERDKLIALKYLQILHEANILDNYHLALELLDGIIDHNLSIKDGEGERLQFTKDLLDNMLTLQLINQADYDKYINKIKFSYCNKHYFIPNLPVKVGLNQ